MAMAEQVAYNAGMTMIAQSQTAQLKDISWDFCLEVWGQALNAAGVDTGRVICCKQTKHQFT